MYNSRWNKLWVGLLFGTAIPVLFYFSLSYIFHKLTSAGKIGGVRDQAIILFAICSNIITLEYFRKKRWNDAMRGVVFPVIIMITYWLYTYRHSLGLM